MRKRSLKIWTQMMALAFSLRSKECVYVRKFVLIWSIRTSKFESMAYANICTSKQHVGFLANRNRLFLPIEQTSYTGQVIKVRFSFLIKYFLLYILSLRLMIDNSSLAKVTLPLSETRKLNFFYFGFFITNTPPEQGCHFFRFLRKNFAFSIKRILGYEPTLLFL